MSADARWLEEAIPEGCGLALDLGGGQGTLRVLVEKKDWRYANSDIRLGKSLFSVCGDAHNLPFKGNFFSLVVAKDSLEHLYGCSVSSDWYRPISRSGQGFDSGVSYSGIGIATGQTLSAPQHSVAEPSFFCCGVFDYGCEGG